MSNLRVRSRNVEGMQFPCSGRCFPISCFPVWVQQSFSRKFRETCVGQGKERTCVVEEL